MTSSDPNSGEARNQALVSQIIKVVRESERAGDSGIYIKAEDIEQYYDEFIALITAEIDRAVREARIDELERWRGFGIDGGRSGISISYKTVDDRLATLKGDTNE